MNVLQKLRERREEKERTNHAAYADLLRSLANDETADETEVDIVLAMVNRPLEQLESDVRLMKRRISWAAELAAEPARLAELRKREAEYQAALAEFCETRDRLERELNRKQAAVRAVASSGAAGARTELLRTCFDRDLLNREARCLRLMKELRPELAEAESILEQRQNDLFMVRRSLSGGARPELVPVTYQEPQPPSENAKREKFLVADIESREEHVAELRRQMASLQAELAEITELKLVP